MDDSGEEGEDEVDSSKNLTSTVDVDAIKVRIPSHNFVYRRYRENI